MQVVVEPLAEQLELVTVTFHVTPSGVPLVLLSFLTVAVNFTASVPSTDVTEIFAELVANTATLGLELLSQPDSQNIPMIAIQKRTSLFQNTRASLAPTHPV